jgi:pectate lyase
LEERALPSGLSFFPPAVGYGAGATGGNGGPVVVADTAAEFRTFAQQNGPRIIQVQGMLDVGQVLVKSNITIVGDGNDGLIGELRLNDVQNVIIQNLSVTNPDGDGGGDAISLTLARTVWIDHVNVYDAPDGLIDITNASDNVTVSWSKFYYTAKDPPDHNFAMLIGADDTATGDRDKLHVTLHHNWWGDRVRERMPRARFGDVHVFIQQLLQCTGEQLLHSGGHRVRAAGGEQPF